MSSYNEKTVGVRDYILTYLQYLYPQHFLSLLMFKVTRCKWVGFKDCFIRWFIKHYNVDMSLATIRQPSDFPHFNAFFTRALRDDARARSLHTNDLASPADGVISQLGNISCGNIVQAKDRRYSVQELMFGDTEQASQYESGSFVTIYLSPRDYHRVHMPCDGVLRKMTYVPGRLFSVNPTTTRVLPQLFARNERLITHFDTRYGPMAIVMVGAMFVGSMETVWHGLVTPPHGQKHQSWAYSPGKNLRRGEEMGRFNMGSTVIVLLSRDAVTWRDDLRPGCTLEMGEMCAHRSRSQRCNT